jgi:hypothetical protein
MDIDPHHDDGAGAAPLAEDRRNYNHTCVDVKHHQSGKEVVKHAVHYTMSRVSPNIRLLGFHAGFTFARSTSSTIPPIIIAAVDFRNKGT